VFIEPRFTGENESTLTLPAGEFWKKAETAVSSAEYLQCDNKRGRRRGVIAAIVSNCSVSVVLRAGDITEDS
jgi:hypothetical protein